jgi:uncharacterized protein
MDDRYCGLHFVLKVASRCNLNCSYCYVYNKGDDTWKNRPPFMERDVFSTALRRIRRHLTRFGQKYVTITFHGGEPCLAGPDLFSSWCDEIAETLNHVATVQLSLQTNGTLLDERWAKVIQQHHIDVGVSVDGSPAIHDEFRVDHAGRGSYQLVERGLDALRAAGVPLRFLSVIQLGVSGLDVHRHLVNLGPASIDYLLPDFTHDTIAPVRARFGPTPVADFLIPIFDEWWQHETLALKIKIFWNIAWLVLGGDSRVDMFGNKPLGFVFVETDGAIENLDVLRVCKGGIAQTGLNVQQSEFVDLLRASDLHGNAVFRGMPLPAGCKSCQERETCAGGYLPHRYSSSRLFDNPSVWCADLIRLFSHVRSRLDVSPEETALRRGYLTNITLTSMKAQQQQASSA